MQPQKPVLQAVSEKEAMCRKPFHLLGSCYLPGILSRSFKGIGSHCPTIKHAGLWLPVPKAGMMLSSDLPTDTHQEAEKNGPAHLSVR